MFPNPLNLILRRPSADYERGFVREVNIRQHRTRNRRVERLLIWGWVIIAVKCVVVTWLVSHYAIPFNPLWVIAPTVIFAALCTGVYYWRD
jgi:hypothetical protein